ncbi:sensor histidine kinase [Nocardiopsis composta]
MQGRGPARLERDSLEEALAGLCSALSAETGVDARFHCEEEVGGLPPEVRAALLRIAQGALANVREHSGADRVVVTLARIGDRVVLDVIDDGAGFDPGAPSPGPGRGRGLASSRARAEELGGELTVESAPGEGTGVSASFPVGEDG